MSVPGPMISVIMPVYNSEAYLGTAIDSILAQTFSDFEFVIVSEFGTSPESLRIIERYSDGRIRHIRNESHLGFVKSLNLGLTLARGKYIARMDADDISQPERFERQIAYLEGHPDVGILGTGIESIGVDGRPMGTQIRPKDAIMSKWLLLFGTPVAHPSIMTRRELLERLSGYDPSVICEDYDLWVRASEVTKIENLPEVLLTLRIHGGNISFSHEEKLWDTALNLSRRLLQPLLEGELTIEDVRRLRMEELSVKDAAAATRTSDLLVKLCHSFLEKNAVRGREARLVRADATWRLLKLGSLCMKWDLAGGVAILWQAFRLGHSSSILLARRAAYRLVG